RIEYGNELASFWIFFNFEAVPRQQRKPLLQRDLLFPLRFQRIVYFLVYLYQLALQFSLQPAALRKPVNLRTHVGDLVRVYIVERQSCAVRKRTPLGGTPGGVSLFFWIGRFLAIDHD